MTHNMQRCSVCRLRIFPREGDTWSHLATVAGIEAEANHPATPRLADLTQADLKARGFKRCPRCGEVKDRAAEFQHRANGSVFSWCKDCNRTYARERRGAKS